jgi:hypothetical protein
LRRSRLARALVALGIYRQSRRGGTLIAQVVVSFSFFDLTCRIIPSAGSGADPRQIRDWPQKTGIGQVKNDSPSPQWNGKFSLIRFSSVASTTATFASCRFRFALLEASKCRRPAWARNTLPDPLTLKRLATDFFVLRLAIGFGIGSGECSRPACICKPQLRKYLFALDWSDRSHGSYMTKGPMERSHPQDKPAAIQPRSRLFVSLDRRT